MVEEARLLLGLWFFLWFRCGFLRFAFAVRACCPHAFVVAHNEVAISANEKTAPFTNNLGRFMRTVLTLASLARKRLS